jgi:hypothetical protein
MNVNACYRHLSGNRSSSSGVYSYMRAAILLLLALSSATYAAEAPRYLRGVWERWNASDLVCTGLASAPVRTGITRKIEGSDRDQLSSKVKLETCFKGKQPVSSPVRVLGYSEVASKDVRGGYIYSGPPVAFVRKGRNLLFLRLTSDPDQFEIAVPIYETAIRLADSPPHHRNDTSAISVRFALTREFEAALVQFDGNDVSDIDRIFDVLGNVEGIGELARFSKTAPPPIQSDIALALLKHDQLKYEPVTISLLIDESAPAWKRANAAGALGEHGTERALPYLLQVASEPATTDDLKSLHVWALRATERLQNRLTEQRQ